MRRKIVALILFAVLLFEALPLEAIAEAEKENIGNYLISEDMLDRYVELFGWDEKGTQRWHEGMNGLPESASADLSWSFVESLVNTDMANLMDFFEEINSALEDVSQSKGAPDTEWMDEYTSMYGDMLDMEDELSYIADTLYADMSYIAANAEIVWNEEYSPRTRRYTSQRINEAVDRIEENLSVIQQACDGWEKTFDEMDSMIASVTADSPADSFTETLQMLMQTEEAEMRIFETPIASVSAQPVTRMNRLLGSNALPHADVVVVNNEKFAIGVTGADSEQIKGASVTVRDLHGNGKTAETQASGFASFSAFDFTGWQDDEIELDVEVTCDGYRKLRYSNMTQKKGQSTNVSLQKEDGRPYVYGATFNGEDVFNEEQIFYFSRKSTDTLDLAVEMVSASACTVKLDCTLIGNQHETFTQEVSSGDRRVVFSNQWLCRLQPDKPVTVTLTDANGNSSECKLKLTIWRAVLEEPFDDQSKSMNIPWKFGGLGANLPDSIVKPIGGSRIDVDLPFHDYRPKVFFSPNGSGYIVIGANVTDPFLGKHKSIANASKKKIDAAAKAVQKSGWLAQQLAKAGAIWEGGSPKNAKLMAGVDFDISLFAILQGKYTKLTGYDGEDTTGNIQLDGVVGVTFSMKAEVTAQVTIFYCGVSFAASLSTAFGVSLNMHTTWPKGAAGPDIDDVALNYAATGLTINVRFEVGVCAGIGIRGFLGVSINGFAYINLRFNITLDPSMQISIGGGIYVLAEILFIKWRIDIWKAPEMTLYDSRNANRNSTPALMARNGAALKAANEPKVIESKPLETHLEPKDVKQIGDSLNMFGNHVEVVELDGMLFALYLDDSQFLSWKNLTNGKSGNMRDIHVLFGYNWTGSGLEYIRPYVYDFCVSKVESNTAGSHADRYVALGVLTSSRLEQKTRVVDGQTISEYVPCGDRRVYMGLIHATEDGGLTGKPINEYNSFSFDCVEIPDTRWLNTYPKNPTIYACENPIYPGAFSIEMLTGQYGDDNGTKIFSFAHGVAEDLSRFYHRDRYLYSIFNARTYTNLIPPEIQNQTAYARSGGGGVLMKDSSINDENRGVTSWYELTRPKDQELPTQDSRLMYYDHRGEFNRSSGIISDWGWAYTLDEGTISSFQIVREPHRQAEHPQYSIDGLQTDRAFYTVKQDGGYRLRGALVTHYMNDASYAVETRRIDGTDYGVTLPTATFNVARMNGATLIYWLESCSAPEGKTGSYYRVCGTFYDAKKDIMTSRLVLAEINAGDKIPMNLQMTSKGQAYYVLCRKDEQEGATDNSYTAEVYTFSCTSTVDMALVDARPTDKVATAGKYLDTVVTVKNQGNTPIAGFDLEVLEGSENAEPFEIIHVDCLNPKNNRIEMKTNLLMNRNSGDKAVWRVDGVEDSQNGNSWIVRRRTILGDDNKSESLNQTKLLMPTDQICYQVAMQVPIRWEGDKKLFYRVSAINACINWSDTVHDERENADDGTVPLIRCVLQGDGTMAVMTPNGEEESSCWPLNVDDMAVYTDEIALDTEAENLWIEGRRIELNGEDTVSLAIGNEAEWNGIQNNAALYVTFNEDESTRHRVADLDQIIGEQGLYTGDVLNMTMPLALLTGGADPETLTLEIVGDREEMISADSRWELQLREPDLAITKQPESQIIAEGGTACMSVEVEGGVPPYSFQWQKQDSGSTEWKNIPNAVGSELYLVKATVEADSSAYRCVITDENGDSVTSLAAIVRVTGAPIVPATGDPHDPRVDLLLLLASGAAAIFVLMYRKRRYKSPNK